jgi:signal peptidase II
MGLGLAVAVLVAAADQLSKYWVLGFFAGRTGIPVVEMAPFFNLVLTGNRGVSFGMFNNDAGMNTAVFTAVAAVIVVGLLVWLRRAESVLLKVALGMVIGGAVGNVADRLIRGAVVDFLDFHLGDWHWFAFNIADSGICLGVAALLIDGLIGHREPRK